VSVVPSGGGEGDGPHCLLARPKSAHRRHVGEQWVQVIAQVREECRPLQLVSESRETHVQGEGERGGGQQAGRGAAERRGGGQGAGEAVNVG